MKERAVWMGSGGFAGSSLLVSSGATKPDEKCCCDRVRVCMSGYVH